MMSLSRIGFGGLTVSGVWGPTDNDVSIKAIHKALEEKITWVDTSPIYGLGHSESIIGEALKEKRNEVVIATKCGLYLGKDQKAKRNLTPEFIFQDIQKSLQRLQVSEIDLYQCHWPDPDTPVEETWEAMRELVHQGKVREIGVCNFGIDLLQRIQKIHPVYSLQIPYNILRRGHEEDLIPFCTENNIRVLAYSPLHLGLLSGKHDPAQLSLTDRRRMAAEWGSEDQLSRYFAFIEKMKTVAEARRISVAQLALAWILNNSSISSIIAGMRTPFQVSQNAKSLSIKLSEEEKEFLKF